MPAQRRVIILLARGSASFLPPLFCKLNFFWLGENPLQQRRGEV